MGLSVPRDAILMALSQAARVLGPGLAMIILATQWEPAVFGDFVSLYALASLLILPVAAGLSAYLLDRIARSPEAAKAEFMEAAAYLLMWVAVIFVPMGLLYAFGLFIPSGILILIVMFVLMSALVDLFQSTLRALQNEMPVTIITSSGNIALLLATYLLSEQSILLMLIVWFYIRFFQLISALQIIRKRYPGTKPRPMWMMKTKTILPFIASQSAGVLYAHLDTLLVRAFLGEAAAGLYNAALRLLQLGSMAAQSLSQWFQPRLAAVPLVSDEWLRQRMLLRLCLGVIAAGGLVAFTLLGEPIIGRIYGLAYADAAPILIIAGLVLAARCFVASQWMELTARQLEGHRARDSWLLLVLFGAMAWPLATAQGGSGVMLTHLLALGPIAAFSARSLARAP